MCTCACVCIPSPNAHPITTSGSVFECVNDWGWGDVKTIVAGLIEDSGPDGVWKLLVGAQTMNGWQVGRKVTHTHTHTYMHTCMHTHRHLSDRPPFSRARCTLTRRPSAQTSPSPLPSSRTAAQAAVCSASTPIPMKHETSSPQPRTPAWPSVCNG